MTGRGTAVVTGASSGIGAATATRLAAEGFSVVVGARRADRLDAVAQAIGARALALDVTDAGSIERFCAAAGDDVRVLVNNAGGAVGRDAFEHADLEGWRWMYEANVLGAVRTTQALLPALEASGDGHVVLVGSIAGFLPYPGGSGYNASKAAAKAAFEVLRMELLGRPLRVTQVDPGMVETEFSVARFGGDVDRAAAVYAGMTPLTADDVADAIAWAVTRPSHVDIDQIVMRPRDQAAATMVHRRP